VVTIAGIFALFLSASARAQADRQIVTVNGTPIRQSEVMERLWRRFGPETLDEMVDELLLRQAARAKKVKAEPAEIEKRLARLRGQFPDPKLLDAQLAQTGSSLEKLREDLSQELSRDKLVAKERGLSVSDSEIKQAFEANREKLGTPAGVHVRHMVVKTEADAAEIVRLVKAGGDFAILAKERSLAPTGKFGGDYGIVSKGMLPPDMEAVVFAMKPNDIRTLPSSKGTHVLQTLEARAAVPAEFSKVKGDLRAMILQEKVRQALPDYLKELRSKADIKPQGS
jgi:foldase protein PrsA